MDAHGESGVWLLVIHVDEPPSSSVSSWWRVAPGEAVRVRFVTAAAPPGLSNDIVRRVEAGTPDPYCFRGDENELTAFARAGSSFKGVRSSLAPPDSTKWAPLSRSAVLAVWHGVVGGHGALAFAREDQSPLS